LRFDDDDIYHPYADLHRYCSLTVILFSDKYKYSNEVKFEKLIVPRSQESPKPASMTVGGWALCEHYYLSVGVESILYLEQTDSAHQGNINEL